MIEINLNWQGPIFYKDFEDGSIDTKHPDIQIGGIYIWCLDYKGKKFVDYIGQSDNIKRRHIKEHFPLIKNATYSLCDIKKFKLTGKLDIVHISGFCFLQPSKEMINDNLYEHEIYFTEMATNINGSNLKTSREMVEGALQIDLFLKHDSRVFLTTSVSNYSLRNTIIYNNFNNVDFYGLNSKIISPTI